MSNLPVTIDLPDGEKLFMDFVTKDVLPEIVIFVKKYAYTSLGIGEDENVDELFMKLSDTQQAVYVKNMATDEVINCMTCYPCAMSRSVTPIYNSGYRIRRPDTGAYTQHILVHMYDVGFHHGYEGFVGRAGILNGKAIRSSYRFPDVVILGVIPFSTNIPNVGWTDDLIVHHRYNEKNMKKKSIEEKQLTTPIKPIKHTLPLSWAQTIHNKEYKMNNTILTARIASDQQLIEIDRMIQDEAINGCRFGIDEFNSDGSYSKKMFKKNISIIVQDPNGMAVAAVLCGISSLCRSTNSPLISFYFTWRQRNVHGFDEESLLEVLYDIVLQLSIHHNCKGLLTDVLSSDFKLTKFLSKNKSFTTIGCIPNSTYVKGQGYTDSYIMYNRFFMDSQL